MEPALEFVDDLVLHAQAFSEASPLHMEQQVCLPKARSFHSIWTLTLSILTFKP